MTDTYLLFCLVTELYRILPRDVLDLLEKMVSSKQWGMGDVCFGCKNEYERHLRFLDLPKKVKTITVEFKNGKPMDIPHCKECQKNKKISGISYSLFNYLKDLQGENDGYYLNPIPLIRPSIPWDPVSKYRKMKSYFDRPIYGSFGSMIRKESHVDSLMEEFYNSNKVSFLPPRADIIKPYIMSDREDFFNRDAIAQYDQYGRIGRYDRLIIEMDKPSTVTHPAIIFNPNAFPSRQTLGHMIQSSKTRLSICQ